VNLDLWKHFHNNGFKATKIILGCTRLEDDWGEVLTDWEVIPFSTVEPFPFGLYKPTKLYSL
jgi:hypothetical protein